MSVKNSKGGPYTVKKTDSKGYDIGPSLAVLGVEYRTSGEDYEIVVPEPLQISFPVDGSDPVVLNEHNEPVLQLYLAGR